MDLKEYILPQNTFIGGWYIPSILCDDLVKVFKAHPKNQSPGVVGPPPLKVDPEQKESTEVAIDPQYNDASFIIYRKYLEAVIHKYEHKYPEVKTFEKFGMVESPQIQYYKPGQGFKIWHCERDGKQNRCLVFMTFFEYGP